MRKRDLHVANMVLSICTCTCSYWLMSNRIYLGNSVRSTLCNNIHLYIALLETPACRSELVANQWNSVFTTEFRGDELCSLPGRVAIGDP